MRDDFLIPKVRMLGPMLWVIEYGTKIFFAESEKRCFEKFEKWLVSKNKKAA